MAQYTTSILDIIQAAAPEGAAINPLSPGGYDTLVSICKQEVFADFALQQLTPEYRDKFCYGFMTRFLFDEIGVETVPAWQMNINGTLFRNAEFINNIYRLLDNQVIGIYSTQLTDTVENSEGIQTHTNNNREDTVNVTESNGMASSENQTNSSHVLHGNNREFTQGGGSLTTQDNSSSTVNRQGTVDNLERHNTVDRLLDDRTQTGTLTPRETSTITGGTFNRTSSNDSTVTDGTTTNSGNNTTSTNANEEGHSLSKSSDYPQTQVSNPLDNNYLSGAGSTDSNGNSSSKTTGTNSGTDHTRSQTTHNSDPARNYTSSVFTDFNGGPGGQVTTRGGQTTNVEQLHDDRTETHGGSNSNTQTNNLVDTTRNNGTQTRTDNTTTDRRLNTDSDNAYDSQGMTFSNNSQERTDTGERIMRNDFTGATENSSVGNQKTVGNVLTWQALAAASPLIEKVWALFRSDFLWLL